MNCLPFRDLGHCLCGNLEYTHVHILIDQCIQVGNFSRDKVSKLHVHIHPIVYLPVLKTTIHMIQDVVFSEIRGL